MQVNPSFIEEHPCALAIDLLRKQVFRVYPDAEEHIEWKNCLVFRSENTNLLQLLLHPKKLEVILCDARVEQQIKLECETKNIPEELLRKVFQHLMLSGADFQ